MNIEVIEEAFAHCLDDLESGQSSLDDSLARYPQYKQEFKDLLTLIGSLNSLGNLPPREIFVSDATQELIARLPDRKQASRLGSLRLWQLPYSLFQRRLRTVQSAIIAIAACLLLALGGFYTVNAAGPGDWLYGYDRMLEQLELDLARTTEAAARSRLEHARERLEEAQHKLEEGSVDHVIEALISYDAEVIILAGLEGHPEAVDQGVLAELLITVRTTHVEVLSELLVGAPETAQVAIQQAIEFSNPAVDIPGGSSEDLPPGKSGGIEPSEEPGPSEEGPAGPTEAGPPGESLPSGLPDGVGPPDEIPAGPPEGPGPPEEIPAGPPESIGPPVTLPADPLDSNVPPDLPAPPDELPAPPLENVGPPSGRP